MQVRSIISAALLWCALAVAAAAQGASVSLGPGSHDSTKPVEITSENLALDQENGTATFTGNVIVRQGGVTMTCDRMLVEFGDDPVTKKNEIRVINMYGGVTFVTDTEAAEAETAVYTLATEIVVMTGGVLVTQGATALSADRLTYNLDTGTGQLTGNVKTVLQQGN